jgi:site-specific recombinase XerD
MHAVSNEPLLDEFEEHLRQQGYKRKSIQLARPSCRRFLAYLKQHGLPLEQVTPDILDTDFQERVSSG